LKRVRVHGGIFVLVVIEGDKVTMEPDIILDTAVVLMIQPLVQVTVGVRSLKNTILVHTRILSSN
jgi:hypothetical protein